MSTEYELSASRHDEHVPYVQSYQLEQVNHELAILKQKTTYEKVWQTLGVLDDDMHIRDLADWSVISAARENATELKLSEEAMHVKEYGPHLPESYVTLMKHSLDAYESKLITRIFTVLSLTQRDVCPTVRELRSADPETLTFGTDVFVPDMVMPEKVYYHVDPDDIQAPLSPIHTAFVIAAVNKYPPPIFDMSDVSQ